MSASTANAIKALIEAGGLGLSAYSDVAPEGTTPWSPGRGPTPFVTITEGIAITPAAINAPLSGERDFVVVELVQVSLWQAWRDPESASKRVVESKTLPDALLTLLHGAQLPTAPTHVWAVFVRSILRLLERSENVVQHPITVELVRDTAPVSA